jgi:hypothetical protein
MPKGTPRQKELIQEEATVKEEILKTEECTGDRGL